MKYHYETVIPANGNSFETEEVVGPVVDCIFHVHPELELTYVESSFGVRFIGDNIGDFQENDLVLIGSMLPHHYFNAPQDSRGDTWSRLKVIKLREDFAGRQLFELSEFSEVRHMLSEAASGLVFKSETALEVRPLLNRIFAADGALRVVLLLELLARLARSEYTQLSSNLVKPCMSTPDERMARVLAFIHGCMDRKRKLSLAGAAEVACLTPQAFSHYFHKNTRKKFIDYVTELKIGRACGLIASSDQTIAQISQAAGFRNLSNFNRHFARLKNMPPREYRKRIRSGMD
jgi:AraC-like DNA-binding protein